MNLRTCLLTRWWILFGAVCFFQSAAVNAEERGDAEQRAAERIAAELPEYIVGKRALSEVRFEVVWSSQTMILHGDGVGFWNHTAQFRVPQATVIELLQDAHEVKLAAMKPTYGVRPSRPKSRPDTGLDAGPTPTGYVRLSVRELNVTAEQILASEPHPPLAALAKKLLRIGKDAAAKEQVVATSLQDGIEKLVDGTLGPAALSLHVYRVEKDTSGLSKNEWVDSWILRIRGRRATLMPGSKAGFGKEIHGQLSEMQLHELHTTLSETRPWNFAKKLHARHYTDFSVQVMQQKTIVNARPYKEITPAPDAKSQENFTQLVAMLEKIKKRIEKSAE